MLDPVRVKGSTAHAVHRASGDMVSVNVRGYVDQTQMRPDTRTGYEKVELSSLRLSIIHRSGGTDW